MKNQQVSTQSLFIFIGLLLLVLNSTSCIYREASTVVTERETFTLDLPNFSVITLDFSADVFIYEGDQQEIKIIAQPEIFEAITKTVIDDEWLVDLANFNGGYESVTIEITMPTIKGLYTTSTGDIFVKDKFDGPETLELSVKRSGDITYRGNPQLIDLKMNGTGDVDLSGTTQFLKAQLSSSGDLSAFDLKAQIVELSSRSSGDAAIRVDKKLDVIMTSSGDVEYKGRPQITSNISGSGDLEDAN
ncbi:MAG: head GIN domain-containing protein [Bacteroidota bacterium]